MLMAKGDGVVLNVVGLVIAVVSLFLVFYATGIVSWTPSGTLSGFFMHMDLYGSALMMLGTLFSNVATIFSGLALLFPILFIVACICILVGVKGSGAPGFGAFVLLLYPLAYIIFEVIVPAVSGGDFGGLFLTMQAGAYLMLIAGILVAIGASRNGD